MIIVTGAKVYIVLDPNSKISGVFSSHRLALDYVRDHGSGWSFSMWEIDNPIEGKDYIIV